MTTIVAIPGSLRADSFNRRLVEAAVEVAPAGVQVDVADLVGVPLFDEDREDEGLATPALADLVERIRASDALLIATPEYNKGIPGVLKNALDWLSRTSVLSGRPAAVMGATPGGWGTRIAQHQLRETLVSCRCLVQLQPEVYVRRAGDAFADGRLVDDAIRGRVADLVAALADFGERLGSH